MGLAVAIETGLRDLPERRRKIAGDGIRDFAKELMDYSSSAENPEAVRAAGRAAVDLVELMMRATSSQLARLEGTLAELRAGLDAERLSDEELEASGRLQVLTLYRAIEEASLKVAELEAAGVSRQRLKQLRDQDRLLGIRLPFQKGFLYPRWQFGDDLRPKSFLPEILGAAREQGHDALTVHRLISNPGLGGGPSLLELCEQGQIEPALAVLRTAGELGA